ncbi:MAG TPA: amidase [Acidimicrobiia bacterium]|jgi:aspartyl-tRNA(Asn)/glutamyl-tRNA(Gln) amidotransferase subunit A
MTENVVDVAEAVRSSERSPTEVVEAALARIAELDPAIHAFCALDADGARAQAAEIERRLASGDQVGPLAGVPIGVKDLEDAAGFRTVCGDPVRAHGPTASADSVEVARLRAAGAVVVGKTNTPAYGFHAETDNLVFGPTGNPWAPHRTSGGSSGGSGAAVAAGLVSLCTGSDGGGSIRIPSAVCGIAGFKPTHGVVPNGDVAPPTWGPLSTRGPMARTFAEIAYALDVVKGVSALDLLSFDLPGSFADAATRASLDGVRAVWSPTLGTAHPDADVIDTCEAALRALAAAGLDVVDTTDAIFDPPAVVAWIAQAAPGSWHTATSDPTPWEGRFLPAAQFTAAFGEHTTAAQMLNGQSGAHVALQQLAALWERASVLITPAMATVPPKIGEPSPYGPGWAADYTMPFNLVRSPAAVVPCGFVERDGDRVPIALQIVAPRCADLELMSIATGAEAALGVLVPPRLTPQ